MIYGYKPISHNIYLYHEHISYMFRNMFELKLPVYNEKLLVHNDFVPLLNSAKATILEPFKEIVKIFYELPFEAQLQLKIAFSVNNSVACFDDVGLTPINYDQLHPKISAKLKIFWTNLWTDYPQVVQMESDFGTVKEHYDILMHENNCPGLVCPYCGLETFEPAEGKYREDYDHLLAKADYPFVSINFNFLTPACKKCNSNEKRGTDALFDGITRRRTYNPYDSSITFDDLDVSIVTHEPYDAYKLEHLLRSVAWDFEITRNGKVDERITSWDKIYNLKRRYTERTMRLEKEWFAELQRSYKRERRLGVRFIDFRSNFLASARYQVLISGLGIIRYFYFKFLFSTTDFENKLAASIN